MRLSSVLAFTAHSFVATADLVRLKAHDQDGRFMSYLSVIDAGAPKNRDFYLHTLSLEMSTKFIHVGDHIFHNSSDIAHGFSFVDGFLAARSRVSPDEMIFNPDHELETHHQLWVCQNVDDPMRLSRVFPMIVYDDEVPSAFCKKITLVLETLAEYIELQLVDEHEQPTGLCLSSRKFEADGRRYLVATKTCTTFEYHRHVVVMRRDKNKFYTMTLWRNWLMVVRQELMFRQHFDSNGMLETKSKFCMDDELIFGRMNRILVFDEGHQPCNEVKIKMVRLSRNTVREAWPITKFGPLEEGIETPIDGVQGFVQF